MSEHRASVRWASEGEPFTYDEYGRAHTVRVGSGATLDASAAPEYRGHADRINPEEMLVSALASCHMLTFLAIAARKRLPVLRYEDDAVGTLAKNTEGRLALTEVVLRPRITFAEGVAVTQQTLDAMHALAHANCFIASSCRTAVRVESLIG